MVVSVTEMSGQKETCSDTQRTPGDSDGCHSSSCCWDHQKAKDIGERMAEALTKRLSLLWTVFKSKARANAEKCDDLDIFPRGRPQCP